ncbi:hypothetical protein PBCV1_a240cL [Paramecium bursaria Chlorella virus 1]|uniref:Uncharacterized protein n=1 Tax=Paramecium bursaria Chlorella virus 1 TaxID=10506 RepID=F8TU03_PBCV1|nr:hypothetical protein PBCV1_a240cL [Paramecium bursaria Chlorella virus 1]AEI70064.1 hypothetical protein [Paramecium bursaria Chlorella virus 1]
MASFWKTSSGCLRVLSKLIFNFNENMRNVSLYTSFVICHFIRIDKLMFTQENEK